MKLATFNASTLFQLIEIDAGYNLTLHADIVKACLSLDMKQPSNKQHENALKTKAGVQWLTAWELAQTSKQDENDKAEQERETDFHKFVKEAEEADKQAVNVTTHILDAIEESANPEKYCNDALGFQSSEGYTMREGTRKGRGGHIVTAFRHLTALTLHANNTSLSKDKQARYTNMLKTVQGVSYSRVGSTLNTAYNGTAELHEIKLFIKENLNSPRIDVKPIIEGVSFADDNETVNQPEKAEAPKPSSESQDTPTPVDTLDLDDMTSQRDEALDLLESGLAVYDKEAEEYKAEIDQLKNELATMQKELETKNRLIDQLNHQKKIVKEQRKQIEVLSVKAKQWDDFQTNQHVEPIKPTPKSSKALSDVIATLSKPTPKTPSKVKPTPKTPSAKANRLDNLKARIASKNLKATA